LNEDKIKNTRIFVGCFKKIMNEMLDEKIDIDLRYKSDIENSLNEILNKNNNESIDNYKKKIKI